MDEQVNTILQGDCIEVMNQRSPGTVDLVFADPPFNIGYDYDVYDDRQEKSAYLDWSRKWIGAVHRLLKPNGTFWLAIGDEYAAELKVISQEIGFHSRSWVIWYYTFGVNCERKFTRSHAHLFYFVKDPANFTFRWEEMENRIPSARQLVYNDKRANSRGRLPDDTWILRPQDIAESFTAEEDTWYFPRVAGTFKERAGFHGCQMPEQLLGRIIRFCSQPGDLVYDPFSGSATTVAVAKKLGRQYLASDLSSDYVKLGLKRLELCRRFDLLDGSEEPRVSAPVTPTAQSKKKRAGKMEDVIPATSSNETSFESEIIQAFLKTRDGYSADRVIADPDLNAQFIEACDFAGLPGDANVWNLGLTNLRKSNKLNQYPTTRETKFKWTEYEDVFSASEIALSKMRELGDFSLDAILCNPLLAKRFDEFARKVVSGHSSLLYRWSALKLRKDSASANKRAAELKIGKFELFSAISLQKRRALNSIPKDRGVFLIQNSEAEPIYAGESWNLYDRLNKTFSSKQRFWRDLGELELRILPLPAKSHIDLLGYRVKLVERRAPSLNYLFTAGHAV